MQVSQPQLDGIERGDIHARLNDGFVQPTLNPLRYKNGSPGPKSAKSRGYRSEADGNSGKLAQAKSVNYPLSGGLME
jgi:hypothetical protein